MPAIDSAFSVRNRNKKARRKTGFALCRTSQSWLSITGHMPMDDDSKSTGGAFKLLTEKQAAVLELLAHGLTSKEIGHKLGTSESAVNRHIEILRSRFGDITRQQLARRYRDRPSDFPRASPPAECVETTKQIIDLAESASSDGRKIRDEPEADLAFQDSLTVRIDAPWTKPDEPRVVPRVLDGENATLTRGAAIAIILLAIIASLVLGLALAQGIAEVVN
ncbi:Two component LuxR family transcriptional regulator [Sphingopyxis sp. LC81]|uniref:response regulator transcription factor n=1 Tax=Sphingopyxis sp. LC81 TaxID=1502850 RepID=UPI00050ECE39|nr:helix-turn-helix transcriptional regulator [Sphingopyxis sp. LC81]KGB54019.1 Two component LuxR family transcriptional regulator [Sphingopyxis sp. LC81]